MGKIGTSELLLILLVALLIFGPSKLPVLGKLAGKAIVTLRHYADSANWDEWMEESETPADTANRSSQAAPEATDTQATAEQAVLKASTDPVS